MVSSGVLAPTVSIWCLVGHETALRRIVPELRGAAVQSYVRIWCLDGVGGARGGHLAPTVSTLYGVL